MNRQDGFTLIELIVTTAICALLMGVGYSGWIRQRAIQDVNLAAATIQQAISEAQGKARRGTETTISITDREIKFDTQKYALNQVKITKIGMGSIVFTPPYGTIKLASNKSTPIVYTLSSNKNPDISLKLSITSILGKTISIPTSGN